ncbi:MAG: hypothetical protein ACOZCO_02615 [Bacteroidota bacterium]
MKRKREIVSLVFLTVFSFGFPFDLFAQIKVPQTPSFNNQQYGNSPVYSYGTKQGATANDVIRQTYNFTPGPVYTPGMTQQEIHQANMIFIRNQMMNDPSYNYALRENKQQQELNAILKEIREEEKNLPVSENYNSESFLSKTKSYHNALHQLKNMLEGKQKISVAAAYFEMESAYGSSYLTKKEYESIIKESADFIKKWLAQNGYDLKSNEALHLGIQKFMGDTLTITSVTVDKTGTLTTTHFPFSYDFEDFKAEKDFRNYFLTKSLATGSGQCNSLPAIYNVLTEALGAKSYLTFTPHHSFIKYPGDDGKTHNYEPTSNWNISDEWYMDHFFINPRAVQSRIYFDTLNQQQMVANCVIDLAHGYLEKFGAADGKFIFECLKTALPYFPKQNHITAYFIYSSTLARLLDRELKKNNITQFKDISKSPEAEKLYAELMRNEQDIKNLGYQEIPEQLYEQMMQQHEFKGNRQKSTGFNGKEKRSLFTTR